MATQQHFRTTGFIPWRHENEEKEMNKLIVTLALAALLIPTSYIAARDANQDALATAEKARQVQQKKEREKLVSAGGGAIQVPQFNPSHDSPDYDAPGLWQPAP
jgi:hypothetical protein